MRDLFDSLAPAINASSQWGPALIPPVIQTILPGGATSLREAMAMNQVLRQADSRNGLLGAQYVMPGPLASYSNIPIQATALWPPLTPPPATELHQQTRPRFVWTPELHAQFEAACNTLGLDNAKPKSILKLMDVDGLTKANIKSHLQKYRCMMTKRSAEAGDGEARPAKAPRVQRRGSSGSVARSSSAASLSRVSSTASFDSSSDAACSPREPAAADPAAPSRASSAVGMPGWPSRRGAAGRPLGAPPLAAPVGSSPLALHQNLEAQETTLREQMELQRQLSDQLQAQQQQQAELQLVVQGRRQGEPHPGDEAAASKMAALQQLKAKLQTDLREHLAMQQDLLTILRDLSAPPPASTTA